MDRPDGVKRQYIYLCLFILLICFFFTVSIGHMCIFCFNLHANVFQQAVYYLYNEMQV